MRTGLRVASKSNKTGKRANYVSIQMSHHVPCLSGEVSRVRTGFEKVVAHRTSEIFSVPAKADGKVIDVNEKLKIVKIQYVDTPIVPAGKIKLPYPSNTLAERFKTSKPVMMILSPEEIKKYHRDMFLEVDRSVNAKVFSIDAVKSVDGVPDEEALKAASATIKKLQDGAIDLVYVMWMELVGKTVPGQIEAIHFEDRFSNVSGSYLKQETRLNVVNGEEVKRGDILAYNPGFFVPNYGSKQVSWKHGVMADMAVMEVSATLEDGCLVSKPLSEKLVMSPAHVRTISIDNRTVIHKIVSEGDHLESTDKLCTIQEGDLAMASGTADPFELEFVSDLTQDSPRSKYAGVVAEISIYFACEYEDLDPSIKALVKKYDQKHRAIRSALVGTTRDGQHQAPGQVTPGLKYHGVDFIENTVVIEFIISEDMSLGQGDKIVVMNANKSVISAVMEKQPITESGRPLDMVFGTTSLYNRIVNSPFEVGAANLVLETTETNALDIWDE